mgnify:CR=1 FL=1
MKKYLFLIITISLIGCRLIPVNDFEYVMYEVNQTLTYKSDTIGYLQSPEESLELLTGDCEDYALLMLDEVWKQFNVMGYIVTIKNGENIHSIVELQGRYYDPTFCVSFEEVPEGWEIISSGSYFIVISLARYN